MTQTRLLNQNRFNDNASKYSLVKYTVIFDYCSSCLTEEGEIIIETYFYLISVFVKNCVQV